MPEFSDFLTNVEKLRLAVAMERPHRLGFLVARSSNESPNDPNRYLLMTVIREIVKEMHGVAGMEAFDQAFDRFHKD